MIHVRLRPTLITWCEDMSPGTFEDLAALAIGEIDISWRFMDKSWRP